MYALRYVTSSWCTDPPELSRHVRGNASLDGERQDETTREIREQISNILQQLAPERAAVDDVKPRFREV